MSRTAAREVALTIIYEISFNAADPADVAVLRLTDDGLAGVAADLKAARSLTDADKMYITDTVNRAVLHAADYDDIIDELAKDWPTERIARITRAILHLALTEINHIEDVPHGTAIDQAVELAKRYDSDKAPAFVNGILGAYVRGGFRG